MPSFKERKEKYSKKPKTEDLGFNFDIVMMNEFCSYVLSENESIHRSSLMNLRNFFNRLDEMCFEGDRERILRFRFCKKALEARLSEKLGKRELIIRRVCGVLGGEFSSLDINSFIELPNSEITFIEGCISSCNNISFVNGAAIKMQAACSDFLNCDYSEKEKYMENIRGLVVDMNNMFRKNELDREDEYDTFTLSDPRDSINAIQNRLRRPSNKLVTGMQGLNNMLAGGFEGSRVYAFFALPGEGKTITLLNLLWQIKKYNKNYVCKDKTKKPCLVLLTMENKTNESVASMYNITCTSEGIETVSTEDAIQLMQAKGFWVTPDNPIDIKIKYRPINSVNTDYLYKLTDDLEDEGYEVIGILQDYVKRIKPLDSGTDERFKLGNVINDFKNFATYKDIPVITASQLNREAAKIIDECRMNNRNDLVKRLGRSNIGESSLIDENLDCTLILTPEYINGQKWMGIKETKHRFPVKTNDLSIYQPFGEGSDIMLMEDEGMDKPLYKRSLMINSKDELERNFGNTIIYGAKKEIQEIDSLAQDIGKAKPEDLLTGSIIKPGTPELVAYKNTGKLLHIVDRVKTMPICYRVACQA